MNSLRGFLSSFWKMYRTITDKLPAGLMTFLQFTIFWAISIPGVMALGAALAIWSMGGNY